MAAAAGAVVGLGGGKVLAREDHAAPLIDQLGVDSDGGQIARAGVDLEGLQFGGQGDVDAELIIGAADIGEAGRLKGLQ